MTESLNCFLTLRVWLLIRKATWKFFETSYSVLPFLQSILWPRSWYYLAFLNSHFWLRTFVENWTKEGEGIQVISRLFSRTPGSSLWGLCPRNASLKTVSSTSSHLFYVLRPSFDWVTALSLRFSLNCLYFLFICCVCK